nr:uncharacterized protein LOC122321107 [Drosophila bipectinata]
MDWIWGKTLEFWCSFFDIEDRDFSLEDLVPRSASLSEGSRSSKRACRVRFSRSTLRVTQARDIQSLASTNPFFNFLLLQRIRQRGLVGLNYLEVVRNDRIDEERSAWDSMDERKRAPYVNLAKNVQTHQSAMFQDQRRLEERGYKIRRSVLAAKRYSHGESPEST